MSCNNSCMHLFDHLNSRVWLLQRQQAEVDSLAAAGKRCCLGAAPAASIPPRQHMPVHSSRGWFRCLVAAVTRSSQHWWLMDGVKPQSVNAIDSIGSVPNAWEWGRAVLMGHVVGTCSPDGACSGDVQC